MPRANRYTVPDQVWHVTQRCHERDFLLRFCRDRSCWRQWLRVACERFGLRVLDYIATSNHVHLLLADRGRGEISRGMQLISGRTAQQFNKRRNRRGAFWEDRYHATAVDHETHLVRCLTYIDLNMVRAGAVNHPAQWDVSGFGEVLTAKRGKPIVDVSLLAYLLQYGSVRQMEEEWRDRIDEALERAAHSPSANQRDARWTEALAIGRRAFVDEHRTRLGVKARHRRVDGVASDSVLI